MELTSYKQYVMRKWFALLAADVASRMILPPAVLPIGALTSFLGAPLFLYLCLKGGKKI